MRDLIIVGSGGFIGAAARYAVGLLFASTTTATRIPLATFLVNVAGCLAIGAIVGFGERSTWLTAPVRLFVLTGVLGGFTTFSAFGYETFALGREGELLRAGLNVAAHVVLGLLAVYVGHRLAST